MSRVNWDDLAGSQALRAVIDPNDRVGIKNALIDRIHWNAISISLRETHTVLDYGCGTGRFAQRLLDLGMDYCGVDTSPSMIECAKKLNPSKNSQFIWLAQPSLPFQDGQFDACLSVMVLQYLMDAQHEKIERVSAELARVLAVGGRLSMIEQASVSGRSSGTVETHATEANYIESLSKSFTVEKCERIRCCNLSRASKLCLRYGKLLPLRVLPIKLLAKFEMRRSRNAGLGLLSRMDYYDIHIEARSK